MKRRNLKLSWRLFLGWLAMNGCIVAQTTKLPITNTMVVQALRVRGVEVNAANVHLPMSMYVAAPQTLLAVTGIETDGDRRLRVLLRCKRAADCVAFTVMVDVEETPSETVLSLTTAKAPFHPESGVVAPPPLMLHAGDHLALSIQQSHFVLKLPCLAVDTGAVGETIRVSTLDRRKTFRAIVTGPGEATGVAE